MMPLLWLAMLWLVGCNQAQSPQEWKDVESVPKSDFAGIEHLFHKSNDTTYVINFWATWCKPCVAELPYFVELHEKYKNEKVKVLLISLDFVKQIDKKLIPFINKRQLEPPVILLDDPDANSWIDKVDPEWSGAIPATVVYNKDKRGFHEQSFEDFESLHLIVEPYIN